MRAEAPIKALEVPRALGLPAFSYKWRQQLEAERVFDGDPPRTDFIGANDEIYSAPVCAIAESQRVRKV
jgi:hypothetical protein